MADVPIDYLSTITAAINQVTGAGQDAARAILTRLINENNYENPFDLVEDALKALEPLFDQITKNAARLSAQAYDIIRLAEMGETFGAIPYQDRDGEWTRKALYGAAKHSSSMGAFIQAILDRMDYEAKRAAGSTSFQNGFNDKKGKPLFARVPTGAETCPFCIMLASRGYVYRTKRAAGYLDHYHSHCDCRVVPSFGGGQVRGYDPDKYFEQYQQMIEDGTLNVDALERSASRAHKRARQ